MWPTSARKRCTTWASSTEGPTESQTVFVFRVHTGGAKQRLVVKDKLTRSNVSGFTRRDIPYVVHNLCHESAVGHRTSRPRFWNVHNLIRGSKDRTSCLKGKLPSLRENSVTRRFTEDIVSVNSLCNDYLGLNKFYTPLSIFIQFFEKRRGVGE